jgi:hypothetical protein
MPANYRIKLVRGDNHIEIEGDKTFVLEMLSTYWVSGQLSGKSQSPRASVGFDDQNRASGAHPKKLSASEFIRQLGFKRHTDMVLAFGYYLEKHAGSKSFTAADINNCYYEAKLESSNTSQMIIQNVKGGRMMPAKSGDTKSRRTSFVLTRSGEEFIEKRPSKTTK